MERAFFRPWEIFSGNWDFFVDAINSKSLAIFYDADGILIDSPKIVIENFNTANGTNLHPAQIDRWDYLTYQSIQHKLGQEKINNSENDWYDPEVLESAPRYLYSKLVVGKTIKLAGQENNFILTSRLSDLAGTTKTWLINKLPIILPENLLIRSDNGIKPTEFKVDEIKSRASEYEYVLFIDDSTKYVEAVLAADIPNCMAINIPLGRTLPCKPHDRLAVIGRYPDRHQGMYPLWSLINTALKEG